MLLFSTVLDINKTLTKDAFIKLVIKWNQGSPHANNIIQGIDWHGEHNVRFGSDDLWLAIEEYRKQNIISVRYEKKEEDGAVWDTDYVMNFDQMKMAIRLDRSYTSDAFEISPKFSTPHFITLLIEAGYLKDDGNMPVLRTVTYIDENNLDLAEGVINDVSHYRLPVVYISKTYTNHDPVDVHLLASRLKGIAHVLVQKDIQTNIQLRKECDDNNEYYGAVGIYYPTKAMPYRRYLYREVEDFSKILLEKVVRSVIQYGNSQMVDTLFTWQGVDNALLRERLISNQNERQAAEKARQVAEAETAKLNASLDEEERRIHKQAIDDAEAKANKLLESFDSENQKLQQQVGELTRANEILQYENQGLKAKIDSRDEMPVLYMGDEYEFYPGEVKDLLLATLSDSLSKITPKSRRADVVTDIINSNDYQKLSESKADEVKRLLKNYDGMSNKLRQALKDLGFEITEEGKHYKLTYYGDGRYQVTYAKTPSDYRSGKNDAQITINIAF